MTRQNNSSHAILVLLLLSGCGGGQPASVTGTVTLDGAAIAGAYVVFIPVEKGPLAYANTSGDGTFEVKTGQQTGLPAGKYKVTVTATKMPEYDPSNEEPVPIRTSPDAYASVETTPFEVEVAAGSNSFPLKLVSP